MAGYRKLGRTSSQRKALLRNQVTNLLYNGKIVTTEARAKEIRGIAESIITMAIKEKDNFETDTKFNKVVPRDEDGKKIKEYKIIEGNRALTKNKVNKTVRKDSLSRLHARRKMLSYLYPVTEVPKKNAGKKRNTKKVDLVEKLFSEIAPKYVSRNGGYTRIIKIGQRKGDAAMEVLIELV